MYDRENWIDNLKGIGILLVIMGHIGYSEGIIQNTIYSFHMPLFFFLSGYLIFYKFNSYNIKKRIIKLLWPYVTFSLINILYVGLFHRNELFKTFFYSISLLGCGNLWFLPTLLFSELLLIYILKQKTPLIMIYLTFCFCFSLFYHFQLKKNYIISDFK